MLDKSAKIYLAGHRGLVGSAIHHSLLSKGYGNLLLRTHQELDLENQSAVQTFFEQEKPDVVLLAAAKVGGISANNDFPAEFIQKNLAIQSHVIHQAHRAGVQRLLFLGSSCIYPKESPQPIKEEYLLSGPLEPTNRPYALAKIAGIEMCWAYNRQYGRQYFCVMPSNLYGPGDNYDLHTSHVLPAMIRKFHEAKQSGGTVKLWGSGRPQREFLLNEDLADAIVFLLELEEDKLKTVAGNTAIAPLLNVGYGSDISIKELAGLIAEVVGFEGNVEWDSNKPDGTFRKLMDSSRMSALGWEPKVSLRQGIEKAYEAFKTRAP